MSHWRLLNLNRVIGLTTNPSISARHEPAPFKWTLFTQKAQVHPPSKESSGESRAGHMLAGTPNNPMPKKTAAAKKSPKKSKRLAAAATGGAAAGCAAVACCCPCCLLGLIVLKAARVPAEIGSRVARKKKQRPVSDPMGSEQKCVNGGAPVSMTAVRWPGKSPAAEVSEMEEKMWAEFAGTGFWRSSSERE